MVKNKNSKSNSEIISNSLFDFNDIKNSKSKKVKNENFTNNSDSNVNISINMVDKKSKKKCVSTSKTRKSNSNTTAITNKSKTRTSKSQKGNIQTNKSTIKEVKTKVGRKDRKHGWYNGLEQVWIDGIDHWVSITAFRNEKGKEPIYTLNNYVQGLDSYWVMRYIPEKKK